MKLSKADFKEKLARFPLGSQAGKGFDAVCIAHFFIAAAHWFVSEMETEGDDIIMFGYADLNLGPGCAEFGYMSLNEMLSLQTPFGGVGYDSNEAGKTIRELCEEYGLEYDDFYSNRNDYGIEEDEL